MNTTSENSYDHIYIYNYMNMTHMMGEYDDIWYLRFKNVVIAIVRWVYKPPTWGSSPCRSRFSPVNVPCQADVVVQRLPCHKSQAPRSWKPWKISINHEGIYHLQHRWRKTNHKNYVSIRILSFLELVSVERKKTNEAIRERFLSGSSKPWNQRIYLEPGEYPGSYWVILDPWIFLLFFLYFQITFETQRSAACLGLSAESLTAGAS